MSQLSQAPNGLPPDFEEKFIFLKKQEKIEDWFYGIMILATLLAGIISVVGLFFCK